MKKSVKFSGALETTLERAMNALPDHVSWNGIEYALTISKTKQGRWQIGYVDWEDTVLDSFYEGDSTHDSLLQMAGEGLKIARLIPLHPVPHDE